MSEAMVFISVVIPTCHRNDSLAKCLDCLAPGIQSRDADSYEVIVTDDGSRTTAQQLLQEHYPWARWIEGPKRGPAANRNRGVEYANGEWIAFTDDDCLPQRDWLEAFHKSLIPDLDVYEGKTTCDQGIRSPLWHAPVNEDGGWLWSCNMMIKKELFQSLDGFDEEYPHAHMEDVDFRERIIRKGLPFPFIQEAVVNHPPRRLPWGSRSYRIWESEVKYWSKFKRRKFLAGWLLARIVVIRLRIIRRFPFNLDSLIAIFSLIAEVVCVALKIGQWVKKYSCYNPKKNEDASQSVHIKAA